MLISSRLVVFPWLRILREIPWRARFPGARIRSLSGPMLVTSLCVPVTFASDRIVLSHVSTESAVADYSVVLQLSAPDHRADRGDRAAAVADVHPGPHHGRARPEHEPDLLGLRRCTLVCSAALVALADPIGHVIGGDEINLGYFLPSMAALVMLLLALAYPLSMSLVDPAGARFVAVCAVLTLPTNIAMSVWLSAELGAPGPLISMLVVSTTVQLIPILIYSHRRNGPDSRSSSPSPTSWSRFRRTSRRPS